MSASKRIAPKKRALGAAANDKFEVGASVVCVEDGYTGVVLRCTQKKVIVQRDYGFEIKQCAHEEVRVIDLIDRIEIVRLVNRTTGLEMAAKLIASCASVAEAIERIRSLQHRSSRGTDQVYADIYAERLLTRTAKTATP